MFLAFLLLAVQVVFALYASSVVTAAAYDGARIVAGHESQADEVASRHRAEDHVRSLLGRYGQRATFTWGASDDDNVVLTVDVTNPGFLPASMREPMRLDRTTRTVRVRKEQLVRSERAVERR